MKSPRLTQVKSKLKSVNQPILIFFIAYLLFGILEIYNASIFIASTELNDQFYFLKLQVIWVFVGAIPTYIAYRINYKFIMRFSWLILLINIILLILVLIPGIGLNINNASRWLGYGAFRIQPAEFLKISLIIYLSSWLAKERKTYANFKESLRYGFGEKIAKFSAVLLFCLILVVLEPDLGTTIIVGATAFMMFFISGKDIAHLVGSAAIGGVLGIAGVLAGVLAEYRLTRIKTFIPLLLRGEVVDSSSTGYHVQQILIGIGSAGFWGKGFGASRQRFGYLPENTAFTDSIFPIILEEFGMFGGVIIILSWVWFYRYGIKLSKVMPDAQSQYMVMGIVIWLSLQTFLHMAVNVGLLPLTGIPFPFLTYGGSGTLVAMSAMGLLLNLSRYRTAEI